MKADASLAQHALQSKLLQPEQMAQAGNSSATMSSEAARAAAVQFEALLVQTMLKSMRQASEGNPLFPSEHESMFTDMFDQQIASDIAGSRSLGLAESIYRQIAPPTRENTGTDASLKPLPARGSGPAVSTSYATLNPIAKEHFADEKDFISAIRPAATATAQQLGTTAEAVMAVAALESGWGRRMPLKHDGSQSNNLFGIKADAGWHGDVTNAATTEFVDGQFTTTRANFRSYPSASESIEDFGNFIVENPRYHKALQHAENPEQFIREIHDAGYATDPEYTNKLVDILHNIAALSHAE